MHITYRYKSHSTPTLHKISQAPQTPIPDKTHDRVTVCRRQGCNGKARVRSESI